MLAEKSICTDSLWITNSNNGLVNQAAFSGKRTDVRLPFYSSFFVDSLSSFCGQTRTTKIKSREFIRLPGMAAALCQAHMTPRSVLYFFLALPL